MNGEAGSPNLAVVAREWGRIGCIGFGGPPAHVALLRETCVERRGWLSDEDFEHGVAATNLLPGPASTQLAIYCAWRLRGGAGALLGGACFILPGLAAIIVLAAIFLASAPPDWILGLGAGAGAVVAPVAVHVGLALAPASLARMGDSRRLRWFAYAGAGAAATIVVGPWLVLVLLACGVIELTLAGRSPRLAGVDGSAIAGALVMAAAGAGIGALCWTAFKVGALSYGGGFVIVPLMQSDAVDAYGWMTDADFLNAVALGQATPGPVVQTVAVVGYAAAGLGGALLAAFVAFAPSFWFVLLGAERFDRLRTDRRARAFLDGAGPAAIGAILGAAVPLALALTEAWQLAVLLAGAVALFLARRGVLTALAVGGSAGVAAALVGAPLPG